MSMFVPITYVKVPITYVKYIAVSVVWLFVFALFPYDEVKAQPCTYTVAYANPCGYNTNIITTPVFGVADSVNYVPHLYSNYLSRTVIRDYTWPTAYRVVYHRPIAYRYVYYRPRVYYGSHYRNRIYYGGCHRSIAAYNRPRVYYGGYYRPHYPHYYFRTQVRH
jgi:hypothetical protein